MAANVKGGEVKRLKRVYKWRGKEDIRDGAKHYKSLSINDATYSIGDCVYVHSGLNEDSVCQIISLFENLFTSDKEMTVRWFIREYEIPVYLKSYQDKVPNLAKGEVIFIDETTLLSVECIIRKAEVVSSRDGGKGTVFCQWAVSTANGIKVESFKLVKPVLKSDSGSCVTSSCLSSSTGRISSRKLLRPRTSATPILQKDKRRSTLNNNGNDTSSTNMKPADLKRKAWTSPRKTSLSLRKEGSRKGEGGDRERRVLFHDTPESSLLGTKKSSKLKNRRRVLSPVQEEGGNKSGSFKSPHRKLDLSDIHMILDDDDDNYKENTLDDDDDDGIEWEESGSEKEESSLEETELVIDESFEEPLPKRKRGRPPKIMKTPTFRHSNEIVTSSSRKRGRPPKEIATPSSVPSKEMVTPLSQKRGRPRKEIATPSLDPSKNIVTPLSRKRGRPPKISSTPPAVKCMTAPAKMRREGKALRAVIPVRPSSAVKRKKSFEIARVRLHVSSVPDNITCREREFSNICTFIESKLIQKSGGCIYISGVPGTGKTATVYEVSRHLIKKSSKDRKLPHFKFIEINGLKLIEPNQAYVSILKQLTGEKATASKAANSLDEYFSTCKPIKQPIVLLADELDMLWNKKQSVLYNLFDWPTRPNSRLIVLAVANTMDLPERVMSSRVSSRLGLTRLTFNPYAFDDLHKIVTNRMIGLKVFEPDAVLLAARKVAAVTGDARRALDICRRATEIAEEEGKSLVGMMEVSSAIQELFSSPLIMAVKHSSFNQRFFLQALIAEFKSTGLEETTLKSAISRMNSLLTSQDNEPLSYSEILSVATVLGSMRVILFESSKSDLYRKIRLNMSQDDVEFGLKNAVTLTY